MAEHNLLGQKGEQIAFQYLKRNGYQIISTNWRKNKYEIDIIAQDDSEIVFVEVKTRRTSFFGLPEESITMAKQKHLIEGANCYLEENNVDLEARFDVVAIVLNENQQKIKHIKEAFYAEV